MKKHPEGEDQNIKRRQKNMLILTCGVLIGASLLYFIGGKNKEVITSSEPNDSLITDEKTDQPLSKSSLIKEEKADTNDKRGMQQILKHFLESYYSYDYKNEEKHLKESKKYLTTEFYKELSLSEENNTKVQPFAFRKVRDISYSGFTLENGKPHWTIDVKADLMDKKERITGTIEVEFEVDLEKRKDEWVVSYFALTGKGLKENE
ncbi:hypothetical protein [Bacillus velezensis]|uniref:hypothetical protein n=1 Tax=Bacillus velezensis TaxID=492670 RepID=UPI002E246109|nr:hypothetical protein [Bacillus velezensis]